MNAADPRDRVRLGEGCQSFVAAAVCASCGHGDGDGAQTLLAFEVSETVEAGGPLTRLLRLSGLKLSALFGYLLPDFSMLVGAWAGASVDASEGAAALGAVGGFVAALAIVRPLLRRSPGPLPKPRRSRRAPDFHVSQQEFHHER